MRTAIADTREVKSVAKSMMRDGILPSAHKLKLHYDGGQVVRYQRILDEFMSSAEGIEYAEKYAQSNKLPSAVVEFIEPHIDCMRSEMLKFGQFLVNRHEKEREQLCKVYRDEAGEVKEQSDLVNNELKDEISSLTDEVKRKDDLIAEQKEQIANLKQKLSREQSEKHMLLQIMSKSGTEKEPLKKNNFLEGKQGDLFHS